MRFDLHQQQMRLNTCSAADIVVLLEWHFRLQTLDSTLISGGMHCFGIVEHVQSKQIEKDVPQQDRAHVKFGDPGLAALKQPNQSKD